MHKLVILCNVDALFGMLLNFGAIIDGHDSAGLHICLGFFL